MNLNRIFAPFRSQEVSEENQSNVWFSKTAIIMPFFDRALNQSAALPGSLMIPSVSFTVLIPAVCPLPVPWSV